MGNADNKMYANDYIRYFDFNLDLLEKAYFVEEVIKGIPIKNAVSREFEDKQIIEAFLDEGEIGPIVVAWKAGRIKNNDIEMLDGNYLNGYGRQIDKQKMDTFLDNVTKACKNIKNWTSDYFSEIYKTVIDAAEIPGYFGVVYIINLIFFLSKGDLPIYDKFAHKALKSLYMGKKPCEVYVGSAPGDKKKIAEVSAMYMEYIWLLEKVFGKYKIDRKTDRALWAFGHATSEWSLDK